MSCTNDQKANAILLILEQELSAIESGLGIAWPTFRDNLQQVVSSTGPTPTPAEADALLDDIERLLLRYVVTSGLFYSRVEPTKSRTELPRSLPPGEAGRPHVEPVGGIKNHMSIIERIQRLNWDSNGIQTPVTRRDRDPSPGVINGANHDHSNG